jgi:hypothetical protein
MVTNLTKQTIRLGLLALSFSVLGLAQPSWSTIMNSGDEVEYYLYSTSGNTEYATTSQPWLDSSGSGVTTSNRPPYTYNFANLNSSYTYTGGPGVSTRGICPGQTASYTQNLSNTNWPNFVSGRGIDWKDNYYFSSDFTISGSTWLSPTVLGEISASKSLSGVKGLQFDATFEGPSSALGSGNAVETVYVTDEPCSAGDNEYGFDINLGSSGAQTVTFYYQEYTNCYNNGCWYEYANGHYAYNVEHGSALSISLGANSHSTYEYIYQAYLTPDTAVAGTSEDYKFVVSVIDPFTGSPTTCNFGSGSQTCTTDVTISPAAVFSDFADIIAGGSYNGSTGGSSTFSGESYDTVYAGIQVTQDASNNWPSGMSSSNCPCGLSINSIQVGQ